ncbi:m-AAA protease-interacting protein 1, mitochondrial-like [Diadema antillarum]|uniref:m-AAA protease-interacting protein 1, mitochondrial-like n=1 Tax=Diadema antillarum TaxID=105358 RepID=UPI003A8C147C
MQRTNVLRTYFASSNAAFVDVKSCGRRTFSVFVVKPQKQGQHRTERVGPWGNLANPVSSTVTGMNVNVRACFGCDLRLHQNRRHFSNGQNDGDSSAGKVKPVFVAIPNPIKVIRNKIFFWMIRSYFDPDFTIDEFTRGASQALVTISQQIAEGALQNLEGLLSPKLLRELESTCQNFSLKEMSSISLNMEDILHSFPHDITIHYDDKGGKFLFILMRFWCHSIQSGSSDPEVKGFRIGRPPPGVSQEQFDSLGSVYSCTYEFLRDISPGASSRWIITYMQHGKLINTETKGLPDDD